MHVRTLILCMTLAALLSPLMSAAGAASIVQRRPEDPAYASLRNIPGVTDDEIRAIEALQKQTGSFVLGVLPGAEAFIDEYGEVAGYASRVCGWLSGVFGIPFKPVPYAWGDLLAGLARREIDFTSELTAAEQRPGASFTTDAITERPVQYMRISGSPHFADVAASRPLRFAFLNDAATAEVVASRSPYRFEAIVPDTLDAAYAMLQRGQADALFAKNDAMSAARDAYSDVMAEDFFPLIHHPLALSTQNPALAPLISVVQKALKSGAARHLTKLYKLGQQEYRQHKLFQQLNTGEKAYLRARNVVRFAAEHYNYPISFYNAYEKRWQGIAFDVIQEMEALTGLRFERVNDPSAEWPVLLKTLESGEASMLTELLRSKEREGRFVWPKTALLSDKYALLSKANFRDIHMDEVRTVKVGLTKATVYAELFRAWFPDHEHVVEYVSSDAAFAALDRGEVDMVMSSQRRLLALTHYHELTGYKANIVFDFAAPSFFGFHKGEAVLCSIVDKALKMIDVPSFATHWTHNTYDYQGKLARTQRPWLIGAAVLLICVLLLLFAVFQKKRLEGKKLEDLVLKRTAELETRTTELNAQHMLMCLVNDAAMVLLESKAEDYPEALQRIMELFGGSLQADRVYLWRNTRKDDGLLYYGTVCYWAEKNAPLVDREDASYQATLPGWEARFRRGEILSGPADSFPQSLRSFFATLQLQSVLIVPVFLKGDFWGLVSLDDCRRRRVFSAAEEHALRSWGLLAVNAIQRGELALDMRHTLTKLEAVINNYKGIIWSVNNDGVITTFNGQYLTTLGITPSFLEGKNLEVARKKGRHLDVIENVEKTFREGPQDWIHEIDAGVFHSTTVPMRDDKGSLTGVVGSTDDVTPMIRLQRELESAVEAAEVASRSKSVFLTNMSHEIRTPMNAILGITEIQLQNEKLAPEIRELFGRIYSSGDLLLGIINDILDMSKIEAGKLALMPATYEIASLIHDTVQLNVMRIGSKDIEFALHVDENTPATVVGDILRVKQILNNVLSNAFKYTARGRVTLSVSAEAGSVDAESGLTLVFLVSDTGQGMTADQVGRLFEAYARFNLEANRAIEGAGLGMSITQNLVHLMNGTIFVESELARGTTFTVRLPQGDAGAEPLGREVAENLRQFRIHSTAHMKRVQILREPMPYGKVLIVDDMETNIFVARGLLTPYGLTIDSAGSGRATIAKIEQGRVYDIIFMDHMMPEMDGMETTRALRDMGYAHPVVALTANAVVGQAEIFLANGFDDFLSKPIDLREMNAVLNKFVRDRHPPEVVAAARRDAQESVVDETPQASVDPKLAKIFIRDASKAIAALEALGAKQDALHDEDFRKYVINVHGLKGPLAGIGETELSALAAGLELAGRAQDAAVMAARTPAFLAALRAVIDRISPREDSDSAGTTDEDRAYLREQLHALQAACAAYDKKAARAALAGIEQKAWPQPIRERLDAVAKLLLHSKFKHVAGIVDEMMSTP